MALINFLKRKKEQIDKAIPDLNVRQRAGKAVQKVGQAIKQVETKSQQAGARARRQVNRAVPVATSFVKEAPKQIAAGLLRSGAIAADTGVRALQKGEDIVTAPLGSAYRQRLQNLRNRQSARENQILQGLKPLEQKKGQGLQNYLKEAYNLALPEIKSAKQATPLQRGAAVADIGLTLLAPGAGTAIKQAGKQGLKQIAKQYGKTALLQGAGGAAGTATMKDATASDIAKGALAGAVFGTGLKGAGDITRVATPAITRQISKAGQKIQTALDQPKFKPGFASTKPKTGIEPKQPKTEAPVVKLATTETPEQLAKKAVRDIPGFEPAIEAKPAKATRIEPTSALTRLQEKPQSNIIVKSKNNNVPDLTEADVQQIARNTKKTPQEVIDSYGNLTNRVSETSKKPIGNIQASLTDFIRSPKKWENQFVTPQKVLTSQRLDVPETLARQTLDKVIPEKVFDKEPALKSTPEQKARFEINQATRDKAMPKLKIEPKKTIIPEELARETIQKTIKEPISPEIAPVARVSTKVDTKVSPEAKIDDRFPINRNLDRGEKVNYNNLIERGVNIRTKQEADNFIKDIRLEALDIANEYNVRTGKSFTDFVDELESGNLDSKAGTLYDELKNLLNVGNKINETRNRQITGQLEDYFPRKTRETIDLLKSGDAQKNVGNILYSAGFGKKRTGALTEYEKTTDVLEAYFLEAIGPLDEASSGLVKTANQIKNAIQKNTNIDTDGNIKSVKDVDYFSFVKDNMPSTGVNKYENVKTNYLPGTRSVKNRVFQLADRKFYDDFLEPFLDAQQFYDNAVDDVTKLNKNQLNNLASELNVRVREGMSDNELRTRIVGAYKREFFGPATEKFIKNVANIDTRDPNTIRLINDIAEEYIGNEVRKLSVLEKATGGLRLLNAMGVLGFNISTAVQNVLEIKKTFARTGIKNTSQALLDYFQGKSLKKKYGVHSTSNVFEDEGVAGLRQVAPLVFTFSNITEDFKDKVFLSALERLGQSKGLDGNDLKYFVRSNFEQFGIKMGRGENIGLFSGKKGNVIQDIPKTVFQFMQFPIKDTVALVDTLERGFSKFSKDKKMNEDLSTAIGYMGISAVQALVLGGLAGVGLSKSEDKESILQRGLLGQIGFGSQTGFTPLDFITQISRGDITGPQVDLIANIYKYAQAILAPESDRKEEELNKARQEFNRSMLVTFIPASNQIYNKTWKYLLDRERGYFETRGKDKNVANLTTENAWGMIRAFMFGGSYDPERQEYIRKVKESKSPNLGEQESAIFKEVKERQGMENAKQFFEGIMTKREADKALEQLEKGAEAEKPKGMSEEEWSKVKATSEAYITSGLATTDDFVNYFARDIDFNTTGAKRTENESKIFRLINNINDDDKYKKLSPEQKEEVTNVLLEKSRIPRDVLDYYNKSKKSVTIKYQTVLEELDKNLSENPNFDVIDYLVQGRRNINGSRLASQEVLKLLEKDGIITNDQYKALNKLNFIYLDGEFKDKSTKPSQGKGGKGKRQRITLKSLMAGQKRLSEIPKVKDTIPLIKLKTRPKIAAVKLQKIANNPVVKLAPSRKAQTKKLTIRNIRVK